MEQTPHVVEHAPTPGVACVACGYDLRGLAGGGNCPECGTPISFSVRGEFYRFGDPNRVRRLAIGATVIALTLLLAVPLAILLGVLDGLVRTTRLSGAASAVGAAGWVIAHAWGWWMLSEREPGARGANEGGPGMGSGERARVWLRDALLIFVGVSLAAIIVGVWRASAWGTGAMLVPGRKFAAALWLATIAAGVGVLLTGMRHMMAMARRLPVGGLGARAEFLFLFVATISGMMGVSAAVGGAFYGLGMSHAIEFLSQTCGCVSVPLWLVALTGVMITSNALASALRRERWLALELRRESDRGFLP